jgi:hypothetical protein
MPYREGFCGLVMGPGESFRQFGAKAITPAVGQDGHFGTLVRLFLCLNVPCQVLFASPFYRHVISRGNFKGYNFIMNHSVEWKWLSIILARPKVPTSEGGFKHFYIDTLYHEELS